MRFNKWCIHWIEVYKKRFIKDSTYTSYIHASKHITCKKKLEKLQVSDLQKVINKMIDKNLSRSTIKHTVTIMVQAVRRASALGYCKNVDFSMLELPKDKPQKINSLERSEQQLLINNLNKSFYGDFFAFLLFSGMRVGELIALRWSDVDMKNRIINISRTDYRGKEQSAKTLNSQRYIPISDELKFLLERNFRVGNKYVFLNTCGRKINYRSVLNSWHNLTELAGIKYSGLHTLRHPYVKL